MAFYQLFHLIWHEIDRFGCFILKSGFFSKSLVLCLINCYLFLYIMIIPQYTERHSFIGKLFLISDVDTAVSNHMGDPVFFSRFQKHKLKQASCTKKPNDKTFKNTGACFIPQEAGAHDKKLRFQRWYYTTMIASSINFFLHKKHSCFVSFFSTLQMIIFLQDNLSPRWKFKPT